ncbi:peroxidase-related enzyme [Xylanimonas ulmi]|uniref:Putative peroxidase-related enzyme n=1 Tax=Xylanimonas ulmi TaxID=228973 RepID=A0A4V2EXU7_9MICO|nr:peroxidase-related enzyme [Xylanibacterium ulmi]RZS60730.1 putative peroxidase-related enzyme [Xylanibacterium ulmi]
MSATIDEGGAVIDRVGWVAAVPIEQATGTLKEAYDWQAAVIGEPTEFTRLGSLHPHLVMERLRLYKEVEAVVSGLTEAERRLTVFVTSVLNATPHCASGAQAALRRAGVGDELVERLGADPNALTGNPRWDEILRHVRLLTRTPGEITAGDLDRLRSVGLDDRDIVALNNLSAYYSYINRVATGLGLRTSIPDAHSAAAPR